MSTVWLNGDYGQYDPEFVVIVNLDHGNHIFLDVCRILNCNLWLKIQTSNEEEFVDQLDVFWIFFDRYSCMEIFIKKHTMENSGFDCRNLFLHINIKRESWEKVGFFSWMNLALQNRMSIFHWWHLYKLYTNIVFHVMNKCTFCLCKGDPMQGKGTFTKDRNVGILLRDWQKVN